MDYSSNPDTGFNAIVKKDPAYGIHPSSAGYNGVSSFASGLGYAGLNSLSNFGLNAWNRDSNLPYSGYSNGAVGAYGGYGAFGNGWNQAGSLANGWSSATFNRGYGALNNGWNNNYANVGTYGANAWPQNNGWSQGYSGYGGYRASNPLANGYGVGAATSYSYSNRNSGW